MAAAEYHQMQSDREARAIEVARSYHIEYIGLQAWVVQHPDDSERCYLVDMIARRCTCPDWCCTAQGVGIDCKHIIAVDPLWRELTGQTVCTSGDSRVFATDFADDPFAIDPDDKGHPNSECNRNNPEYAAKREQEAQQTRRFLAAVAARCGGCEHRHVAWGVAWCYAEKTVGKGKKEKYRAITEVWDNCPLGRPLLGCDDIHYIWIQ